MRSAKVGMSVVGRLSTQKNPMSSKHLIAWLFPAPLSPVMMTKETESATSALARHQPSLVGRQDAQLLAILGDRPPRDRQRAALEDLCDLLIGQRLRRILVGEQILDHLLHR